MPTGSQAKPEVLLAPAGKVQICSTKPATVVVPVLLPQVAAATKAVWLLAPAGNLQTVSYA